MLLALIGIIDDFVVETSLISSGNNSTSFPAVTSFSLKVNGFLTVLF